MRGFLHACGTFAGALVEDPTNDYRRNLLMLTMGPICDTMLLVNVTFVSVVVRGDHDPPPHPHTPALSHRYPEGWHCLLQHQQHARTTHGPQLDRLTVGGRTLRTVGRLDGPTMGD